MFSLHVSPRHLCLFTHASISPSQGLCCSQDCEFKPVDQICDEETDCQRESVCSGLSPFCPEPSAKENLTVCSQGTRVCLNGVRRPHSRHHAVTQRAPTLLPNAKAIKFPSVQQCCEAGLQLCGVSEFIFDLTSSR